MDESSSILESTRTEKGLNVEEEDTKGYNNRTISLISRCCGGGVTWKGKGEREREFDGFQRDNRWLCSVC